VTVAADGAIAGRAVGLALQALRRELITRETRKRTAFDALQYYATLGITTHEDSGAFHADEPATGIPSVNTYTMHEPFFGLNREGRMPARLRIDFLHQWRLEVRTQTAPESITETATSVGAPGGNTRDSGIPHRARRRIASPRGVGIHVLREEP
jgi:predicted amidohydrolase YtcJ